MQEQKEDNSKGDIFYLENIKYFAELNNPKRALWKVNLTLLNQWR